MCRVPAQCTARLCAHAHLACAHEHSTIHCPVACRSACQPQAIAPGSCRGTRTRAAEALGPERLSLLKEQYPKRLPRQEHWSRCWITLYDGTDDCGRSK